MIQGDLNVRRTGAIDGWCWDGTRPTARLAVELLVDGAVVASVAADGARRDLRRRGVGDGRHAFNLTIDPALLGGGERLVSARDGRTRVVFGQYFVGTPEPSPPDPTLDALERELARMSDGLGRLIAARDAEPGLAVALRGELATLAAVLRSPGSHAATPLARQVAAARAVLARQVAPQLAADETSTLLLLDAVSPDAMAWLDGSHQLVLPETPELALLPSLSPRVRTVRPPTPGLAATVAAACAVTRTPMLAVLTSPGSLAALDDALGRCDGLLLGAAVASRARALGLGLGWREHRAIAATGLLVAASPAVLGDMDPSLDGDPVAGVLDLVGRQAGLPCTALVEPWRTGA